MSVIALFERLAVVCHRVALFSNPERIINQRPDPKIRDPKIRVTPKFVTPKFAKFVIVKTPIEIIAERKLLFSEKGNSKRVSFAVRISAPYIVRQEEVKFSVDGIVAGCHVELDGLNEPAFEVYGMDSLQAVNMASDIEPLLKRLSSKYDFFWLTGEPYFDEEDGV